MNERVGNGRPTSRKARPDGETPAGTFRRLQSRGGQLLHWFPELGKTLLRESEPGLDALVGQIQTLRGELRRRAGETGRDLEARAERLLGELERQAVQRIQPLLNRAHVASQTETGALEERVAHLEGRLGPLLDERMELGGRVATLERQLNEMRADVAERVRELDVRLATADDLRGDVHELRTQLDALAKEHVSRSLDIGKLQDRIVRMEMRFGDLLKEQGGHLADHEDVKKRLGALASEVDAATRLARGAVDDAMKATTTARGSADRLAALGVEHARERTELDQLGERGLEIERIIRQLELRIGDLAERQTGTREDLAGLAARMAQVELTVAPPAQASTHERAEGH